MAKHISNDLRFERIAHWPGLIYRSQELEIPELAGHRPVSLWLPPDYFKSQQAWPVALFFDGQNLFEDEGSSMGQGWQLHHSLEARAQAGKAVPIVVGIHHGLDRDEEMSPWPALPGKVGKAKYKLEWLHTWLWPRLKAKLQILDRPEETLIGGSSLGGLLALYGLFHHPEYYGKALIMSPALWPGRFGIFQALMMARARHDAQIYLDHGQKEAEAGYEELGDILFQQSQYLAELLEILGFERDKDLKWHADPEGEHNERSWARRLPQALDFLYP